MRVRARAARLVSALGLAGLAAGALFAGPSASAAASHTLITGDGSSWASNAINTWIGDVSKSGLQVVFSPNGSAQGRKNFANYLDNFADSDIGYGQDPSDPTDSSSRPYAYLPVVAGGTSFPYHINVAGQLYRSLRLSGQTLAKIFTNQITNWNDPAITADNNGVALPSKPIVPVVRSDGSGATAQFTLWLSKTYPNDWKKIKPDGLATEYWPTGVSGQIAQNGSDQVMNFVTGASGDGTIAFDEYSYPLAANYPAVKLLNPAGYYVLPSQYNVAVALTQATINTSNPNDPSTYLTQDLDNVYTNPDPRSYPISSYSYFIIPTSATDSHMSTAARQTLADFLYHDLCDGQSSMGPLGYSPLPINLVQASFNQVAKLGTADPGVDLTSENVANCHNPTFVAGNPNENYLAQIAPQPAACDKQGAGPCGAVNTAAQNANPTTTSTSSGTKSTSTTKSGSTSTKSGSTSGSSAGSSAGSTGTSTGSTGATSTGGGAASTGSTGTAVDPATGAVDPATGATTGTSGGDPALGGAAGVSNGSTDGSDSSGGLGALPSETTLSSSQGKVSTTILAPLAAILLVAVLIVPVVMSGRMNRRRPGDQK